MQLRIGDGFALAELLPFSAFSWTIVERCAGLRRPNCRRGSLDGRGGRSARTATAECKLFTAAGWLGIVDAWDIVRGLSCVVSRRCSVSVTWLAVFKLGDAIELDNTT